MINAVMSLIPTPIAQSGLADRIQAEGDALVGAFNSPWTWVYLLALLGVLVGSWQLRRMIAQIDAMSMQVRTQATTVISALTLLLTLAVSLIFLHGQAPLLTALSLMLLGVIATVAFGINSRGWVRAMTALWRGRIRIGDWLQIGDIRGQVVEVGLFRVIIETQEGGQMFIPTDRFGREIYAVASPERVFPVEINIVVDERLDEDDLERLRGIATLSPYRETGSSIAIEPSSDLKRVVIRFRAWSEDGARMARAHLVASFGRARDA